MPLLPDLTFPDCNLCERGDRDSIRLLVRNAVDAPALLFHIHISEDLSGLLTRVVVQHPERWNSQTTYYFYIDMGGVYHGIDDLTWLRDRDSIIISELDDVEKLPKLSLNAIHSSLRPDVTLKPHQAEGIDKMIYMERAYRGGILADEMGLGKTLQMLAVVMKQQPKLAIRSATLVVVPSRSIADQWGDEIRSKTTFGSLPYIIYQQDNAHLLEQSLFRVVITTYAQIRTEWRKQHSTTNPSCSLLYSIDWHRIILDEANHIRSLNSQVFESVSDLRARFKWCVTGTPLQNEIAELYPIFTFLDINLDQKLRRNETYMRRILHSRMIRRTKELLSGHLMMMPKNESRVVLEFSEEEKALYDYLEQLLYRQIKNWKATSDYGRSQRASALIYLRLKQVCGHFNIILNKFPDIIPQVGRGDSDAVVEGMYQEEEGIDGYNADEGTELNEVYGLIGGYYDQFGNINEPFNMEALTKLPYRKHSTKIIWLTNFLKELLSSNRSDKVVIVSQFIDLVDRISEVLTKATIRHHCYHGGLTPYHRKTALRNFNHDATSRVLVMSLKAGGVGLNLQTANHMIIMDRWWNPATMDQAIARIHRMTQFKQVYIHTVVIKDTIEEGLMDNVLTKKNELFKTVVETESLDNFLNYADGLETEDEEEEEEDFEIVPEERILQRRAEQREQVNGQGNGVNGHHSNGESSETIHFQNILSESDNPEENYNNSEDEDMDGQVNIWTFD